MQSYNILSSVFCLPHFGAVFLFLTQNEGKVLKGFSGVENSGRQLAEFTGLFQMVCLQDIRTF